MKTCIKLAWLVLLLSTSVRGQSPLHHRIGEATLAITYNKTTSLIFTNSIRSVDRGSRDVLAQKAKGVENVLQLKAARQGFPQTNLTVITADGRIHEFTVYYNSDPASMVVDVADGPAKTESEPLIFNTDLTESEMEYHSARIVDMKPAIRFRHDAHNRMKLALRGIYIRGNTLFCHFKVTNSSNIDYDVDFLRFYVRDKQQAKRTATQEVELKPLFTYGNTTAINGMGSADMVFAVEKFTIPDAKHLVLEMFEENGGRHLKLFIENKEIVNARLIP